MVAVECDHLSRATKNPAMPAATVTAPPMRIERRGMEGSATGLR
jgi:hypothetical protein